LIDGAVTEHGIKNVTAASGQGDEGLVVAFSLRDLPVIVGARDGVAQGCERGKEQGPFQDLVPAPRGMLPADRGARTSGHGCEARVGGEVAGGSEVFARDLGEKPGCGPDADSGHLARTG